MSTVDEAVTLAYNSSAESAGDSSQFFLALVSAKLELKRVSTWDCGDTFVTGLSRYFSDLMLN